MKQLRYGIILLSSAALLGSVFWVESGNAKPSHEKGKGASTETIAPQHSQTSKKGQQKESLEGSTNLSLNGRFSLPRGIQRKLDRGKQMPPGIAKKMKS